MAQVIEGGADVFDMFAYGRPHPGTVAFLSHQAEAASSALTNAGRAFFEGVKAVFKKVDYAAAAQLARVVGRRIRNMWTPDQIRVMKTIGEFQNSPLKIQRYLMAEPTTRALYNNQGCDGFSNSYVDMDPGTIRDSHYDYRRVMDGIVVVKDEGWEATTYGDVLRTGDDHLTLDEQVDILGCWEHLRAFVKARKEDPTDPRNGML